MAAWFDKANGFKLGFEKLNDG